MKADIFSAAATLFIMVMRCSPFRKAHAKDPYFKRLSASDRKPFWNIFKNTPSSAEFKDLFEKLTKRDPDDRISLKQALNHQWFLNSDMLLEDTYFREEIKQRFETVQKL